MSPNKIAIIGAGSASFGLNTLVTLMRSKWLRGSHIALVDINGNTLERVHRLAQRLNQEWDADMHLSTHIHHLDNGGKKHRGKTHPLKDAGFVILSIEVPPRERLWQSDYTIPLKYGVRQPYAENGGPGGFAHAARNIRPVMEIVHAMEHHCPKAWLINFTNPMIRICDAVHRYSHIRVLGLCHQITVGYAMVGKALAAELDIDVPEGFTSTHASPNLIPLKNHVAHQAMDKVEIKAAGLNHFTWMLNLHHKENGTDLYPLFAKKWRYLDENFEPLTRKIYEIFGLFPIPGDEHLCEYLPWMSQTSSAPWEKYDLSLYDWNEWERLRDEQLERVDMFGKGDLDISDLHRLHSEGATEIIESLTGAGTLHHPAVNLPNLATIQNLPAEAIVETPAVISSSGVEGVPVGRLPEAIAELCHREITVARLCVDAAIHGDRKTALQCLLLDPMITDIDTAGSILDDYLATYREHLPQFQA